jgi:hypothetical protein
MGRAKAKDNVLTGNPRLYQIQGDPRRGAIMLNPNLAVNEVEVQHRAMHPTRPIPTDVHDLIVILLGINNDFHLNLSVRWFVTVVLDEIVKNVSITG